MNLKKKKIISIDLDGVLNEYSGNYREDELAPMREGAFEFLKKLSEDFDIEIYTVRDTELCKIWLENNDLIQFVKDVRNTKNPFTSVFLDDRALTFNGSFDESYTAIKNFKPFWKKTATA